MQIPKKVDILDIKCHPTDTKVAAACSDGNIRFWDYISSMNIVTFSDPSNPKTKQAINCIINSLAFSIDGFRLLACNENGKLYCWNCQAHDLKKKQLLISQQISDKQIYALSWLCYNGDFKSNKFFGYTSEGNIKLFEIQQNLGAQKNQFKEKFAELEVLHRLKSEVKELAQIKQQNINCQILLQAHPFANFLCVSEIEIGKTKSEFSLQQQQTLIKLKIFQFYDKLYQTIDYPVNYKYSLIIYIKGFQSAILTSFLNAPTKQ